MPQQREADRQALAIKMAEYEKLNGPVETQDIRSNSQPDAPSFGQSSPAASERRIVINAALRERYQDTPNPNKLAAELNISQRTMRVYAAELGLSRAKKASVKFDWSEIDPVIIAEYADCKDTHALAKKIGLTPQRTRDRARMLGIGRKLKEEVVSERPSMIAEMRKIRDALIKEKYADCECLNALAKEAGCSITTIYNRAAQLGIRRVSNRQVERMRNVEIAKQYAKDGLRVDQIMKRMGASGSAVRGYLS